MNRLACASLVLAAITTAAPSPSQAKTQEKIKVFVDQDTSGPGGTDVLSIAMLLMADNIDVVGIGVVGGDAWLDQAVYHTLKIVEVCGTSEFEKLFVDLMRRPSKK